MAETGQDETQYTLEDGVGRLQDGPGRGVGKEPSGRGTGWAACSDCVTDGLDTVRDITADIPLLALGVATVAGFVTGILIARR
ncbi:hypothetical protein GOB85_12360 [Acetobacter sp. LMG 1636]|uniref:Uncharacterized protein n=2 Tax=Acetobacter fallax TaxID=1737473 RepID=A0ABX0KDQ9_9PROT|nr:hypothetical protein [Acetobacter fallax]NHO33276.1 hypothetical protein [Acetobacter fallax]NHO36896.1 hypothetical protein [Acetobacter fallax]